jgi:transcriptional regulator with XRE-family HTH domain
MLTAFGKFCRKIRIDQGEIMKDMAQKLGVTPAFLSAVETGKRNAPDSWLSSLVNLYALTEEQIAALKKSIEDSKSELKINLRGRSDDDRKVAMAFAREFTSLSETEKQKLLEMLNKKHS